MIFSENIIREIPESSKNTTPLPLKNHIGFFDKANKGFP